jgi:hypothetical protein
VFDRSINGAHECFHVVHRRLIEWTPPMKKRRYAVTQVDYDGQQLVADMDEPRMRRRI